MRRRVSGRKTPRVGISAAQAADVTSSNVVGFQQIAINPGYNMIALSFQPIDGTEYISIQDFVQNKEDLVAGYTMGTSDQIQVWDGEKFDTYFYRAYKTTNPNKFTLGPAWVKTTAASVVTADTIKRGSGVWFARPEEATAGQITVSGAVPKTANTHTIAPGYNMISSAFPADMALNGGNIDWEAAGAVAGYTMGTSDQIQVWDGEKFDTYFYRAYKTTNPNKFTLGPAWVKTTAASTVTTDAIPAGKGFWYARPTDATAGTLSETSPIAE